MPWSGHLDCRKEAVSGNEVPSLQFISQSVNNNKNSYPVSIKTCPGRTSVNARQLTASFTAFIIQSTIPEIKGNSTNPADASAKTAGRWGTVAGNTLQIQTESES